MLNVEFVGRGEFSMQKLGLLAGIGNLPLEFAKAAKGMGIEITAIALTKNVNSELKNYVDSYHEINMGQVATIFETLKKENVPAVTMIGKVTKETLFDGTIIPDKMAMSILASLPNQNDDTLLMGIVQAFLATGIKVMDQTQLIAPLLPKPGILTKRQPTEKELADIEYGFKMAKAIGELDIGQTVVVKDRAIMAVEAIEGTDECILRGGKLGRGEVVVAKTAKPQQDNRFDMPSVGITTINSMIAAKATVLVMEAGRTLFVDAAQALKLADENNIAIVVK